MRWAPFRVEHLWIQPPQGPTRSIAYDADRRPSSAPSNVRRAMHDKLLDFLGPASGVHSLHTPSAAATSCRVRTYPTRRTRLIRG